jgi:hypothetical protein
MNKAFKASFPPQFGSVQLVERIYGLSTSAIVQILRDYPEIEYYEVCRPGKKYGRRLVNLESFRQWFEAQKVERSPKQERIAA